MGSYVGIYIHIPFCVRKCNYCDFLSFPADGFAQRQYVDCLVRELRQKEAEGPSAAFTENTGEQTAAGKNSQTVDTVFIGGGTPSVLPTGELGRIMEALREEYRVAENAEITIECNPGTVDREKFRTYRRLGINRISLGVQSAVDSELKKLGRIHTFSEAEAAFEMARAAGIGNINVDLMSAIPGQTLASYEKTLERVLALGPEHISAYSLIVEEGTPFYAEYADHPPLDEDTDRKMYALTKEVLSENGYERYEISNYAREGYACHHNLKYWSGEDYMGFGLGASSKIGNIRYKNETELTGYMRMTREGRSPAHIEERLNRSDEMSEFFVLGLRRTRGVSLREFSSRFSTGAEEVYGEPLHRYLELGLLEQSGDRIYLTERGLDVSNYVLCDFI